MHRQYNQKNKFKLQRILSLIINGVSVFGWNIIHNKTMIIKSIKITFKCDCTFYSHFTLISHIKCSDALELCLKIKIGDIEMKKKLNCGEKTTI